MAKENKGIYQIIPRYYLIDGRRGDSFNIEDALNGEQFTMDVVDIANNDEVMSGLGPKDSYLIGYIVGSRYAV